MGDEGFSYAKGTERLLEASQNRGSPLKFAVGSIPKLSTGSIV